MGNTKNPRKPTKKTQKTNTKKQNHNQQQQQQLPSWAVTMRSILTCKQLEVAQPQPLQQQQQLQPQQQRQQTVVQQSHKTKQQKQTHKPTLTDEATKKTKKMRCSGSLCNNIKVIHKLDQQQQQQQSNNTNNINDSNNNHNNKTVPKSFASASSVANNGNVLIKGMQFRRLTGCYECRMVVDPSLRATICSCPYCGDIFMKPDNLELHQAVNHAVSELGPEDTSKNIVEIIFQSSWLRKQNNICHIDRILKINNTQKTLNKFEQYRDSIKSKATINSPKKHPRCIADGNELLRFHCTTLKCSLGLNGSTNLCNSIPYCGVCSIIKGGFSRPNVGGILTTATSGRAHDRAAVGPEKRAMLVCRVVAGRVRRKCLDGGEVEEEYDSVMGVSGVYYSNLEELYVFNPRAILPCFVVVYTE